MTYKFNRPDRDSRFEYPTDETLLDYLDAIRLFAEAVSQNLKPTPGGDAYEYRGGMNHVEHLCEAIDHYHGLFYIVKKGKK